MTQEQAYKSWLIAGAIFLAIMIPMSTIGKVKAIIKDYQQNSLLLIAVPFNDPHLPTGNLSDRLVNFDKNTITALATNDVDILVAGSRGALNMIRRQGTAEDLSGMISNNQKSFQRVNALGFTSGDGSWIVAGTYLGPDNQAQSPLLFKLIPDGLKTINLNLEAEKFGIKEFSRISCKTSDCILTAPQGRVFYFDGVNLREFSLQFGFNIDTAPEVSNNGIIWLIAGVIKMPASNDVTVRAYSFDGSRVRVIGNGNITTEKNIQPEIAVFSNNGTWVITTATTMLKAWTLQGTEFISNPLLAAQGQFMPVMNEHNREIIVAGGKTQKGILASDARLMNSTHDSNIFAITNMKDQGIVIGGSLNDSPFLLHVR